MALPFNGCQKIGYTQACFGDQRSKSSPSHLRMIRNGEGRDVTGFG